MSLQVVLSSGEPVETTTKPGAKVSDLRQELSTLLNMPAGGIEVLNGSTLLEDHEEIQSNGTITVLISTFSWLDDGSETIQDLGGCSFVVGGTPKGGSASLNALYDIGPDAGFSHGEVYFEVEVIEGEGAWVGVCPKENFGTGYKCKGLFFGGPGNLSDGGALLRGGFGEKTKPGSTIGFSIDLSNDSAISIGVWQDGQFLGEAFKACPRAQDAKMYPVVRAHKVGDRFRIAMRRKVRAPDADAAGSPLHPALGDWRLHGFTEGSDAVDIPAKGKGAGKGKGNGITLKVKPSSSGPATFACSMKLGNTTNFTVTFTPTEAGESIVVGPRMWTQMMVMGPLGDFEKRIDGVLSSMTRWTVQNAGTDDAELHLCDEGTVELVFVKDDGPGPIEDCKALMPKDGGYA